MRMNVAVAITVVVSALAAGCMNPLAYGPGRVAVKTEAVHVTSVPRRIIFGGRADRPDQSISLIQFEISSDVDLAQYFSNRLIQVRCRVDRTEGGSGYGPFHLGNDISSPRAAQPLKASLSKRSVVTKDGRYPYTVYGFVNLAATRLVDTKFVSTPLQSMRFSELSCFIVGVMKAPVLFPRSNNFSISREQFEELLEVHRAARDAA